MAWKKFPRVRLRLAPQLSAITLDNILSGDTCEPISLSDFEAYLTYKEYAPENLRFVVWYQDYRRRFFALPPEVQKRSPGPGANDFDFGLPTPARIARRAERARDSGVTMVGEDSEAHMGRRKSCVCPACDLPVDEAKPTPFNEATRSGAPLTPMTSTSTAGLLTNPRRACVMRAHSFIPGLHKCHRLRRPDPHHPSLSLTLSGQSAMSAGSAYTAESPKASPSTSTSQPASLNPNTAIVPESPISTPLTSPSLPSPAQIPYPPRSQPFRAELTAIAHTFLLPSSPNQLSLTSTVLSTILAHLAHNTHPDVLLPAYETAYDALSSCSLPRFLKLQEENVGWEKKLYWWGYGLLTTLIGWGIVWGCVFANWGHGGVGREWRLWGVPFLCLGGMQMYAGYRGFCTQVWGRGGMQLHPWEVVHPEHVTLVDHVGEGEGRVDDQLEAGEVQARVMERKKEQEDAKRRSSASDGAASASSGEKDAIRQKEDHDVQVSVLARSDESEIVEESVREPGSASVPPTPGLGAGSETDTHNLLVDRPQTEEDAEAFDIVSPDISPFAFSAAANAGAGAGAGDPRHHSYSYTHSQYAYTYSNPGTAKRCSTATSRRSTLRMSSSIAGDGYKDEWAYDDTDTESPSTPSPLRVTSSEQGNRTAHSGRGFMRAIRGLCGRTRSEREREREREIEKTPLSMRARVYGPERVVLDPRIKAVHRRVMRDILVMGFVWGVVFTVVVLVLPRRH